MTASGSSAEPLPEWRGDDGDDSAESEDWHHVVARSPREDIVQSARTTCWRG